MIWLALAALMLLVVGASADFTALLAQLRAVLFLVGL